MDDATLQKVIDDRLSALKAELAKKSAPDVEKIISMIQELRNQAELDKDADGAQLFTQAIALVLQATGEETSEPSTEAAAEGEEEGAGADEAAATAPEGEASTADEEMALAAKAKSLHKAGRTFSGANAQSMHNVIRTLAAMLAATGDDTATKIAALYTAPAEKVFGLDGLAKADDLTKAVGEMAKAADVAGLARDIAKMFAELQVMDGRLEKVERTPAEAGGLVLRELPTGGADMLSQLLGKVTDPTARQAIESALSLSQIRAAQQSGHAVST